MNIIILKCNKDEGRIMTITNELITKITADFIKAATQGGIEEMLECYSIMHPLYREEMIGAAGAVVAAQKSLLEFNAILDNIAQANIRVVIPPHHQFIRPTHKINNGFSNDMGAPGKR